MASWTRLVLLLCMAPHAAQARLAAPTLLLHANQSLSVRWEPEAGAPKQASYRLLLTMTRPGADDMHVTKLAHAGEHELFWGPLPERARSCFRVASITSATPDEERYSPETCVNASGCDAAPAACDGSTYAFVGAVLGAAITVFLLALGLRAGLLSISFSQPPIALPGGARSRRGAGRSCYSHLTTDEASVELEQQEGRRAAPGIGAAGGRGGAVTSSLAGKDMSSLLEPQPLLDATAFERRWGACAERQRVLSARLGPAGAPCPSPDETEDALTRAGLVCIATGAVGNMHKSYYAGTLCGGGEWFMLELVVFWDQGSVQAAFRADSTAPLRQLADHYAGLLSRHFNAAMVPLPVE
jgi:hypothetical protein